MEYVHEIHSAKYFTVSQSQNTFALSSHHLHIQLNVTLNFTVSYRFFGIKNHLKLFIEFQIPMPECFICISAPSALLLKLDSQLAFCASKLGHSDLVVHRSKFNKYILLFSIIIAYFQSGISFLLLQSSFLIVQWEESYLYYEKQASSQVRKHQCLCGHSITMKVSEPSQKFEGTYGICLVPVI